MVRKEIGVPLDRENRNNHNDNFKELYGVVNNLVGTITDEVYEQIIDGSKLIWKEPVDKQSDLPSDASEGDTRMARDTGKVYRFDGSNWQEIQQIDAGPVNEIDARLTSQLAETTEHGLRVLLLADIHYDRSTYEGMSPSERMEFMVGSLNKEHDNNPVDMLFVLGDLSSNNPNKATSRLITDYLTRLKMPFYVLNGNHDLISDNEWQDLLGYEKNNSLVFGDFVFMCVDSFDGDIDPQNESYGQQYKSPDITWLQDEIAKYQDKNIFILTHYIQNGDTQFVDIVNNTPNIVAVFQGHLHYDNIGNVGGLSTGKPKITCGHFSYPIEDLTQKSWGYRSLEKQGNEIISEMVYVEKAYPDFYQPYSRENKVSLLTGIGDLHMTIPELSEVLTNNFYTKSNPLSLGASEKLRNTSGIKQDERAGIIALINSEYHIDDIFHTGMYYVDANNGAPETGYLIVTGFTKNNFNQIFIPQYKTNNHYIRIRSKASGEPISEWTELSNTYRNNTSDFTLLTGYDSSDSFIIAQQQGRVVTISGKIVGDFMSGFSDNRLASILTSSRPTSYQYGVATLLSAGNSPVGNATIRVNPSGYLEATVAEPYDGGAVSFMVQYLT